MGHRVKLIPPQYVKPFVKRSKNDYNDAEAISEAASRPSMRTVPVKAVDEQAATIIVKHRETLVGQRAQAINALPRSPASGPLRRSALRFLETPQILTRPPFRHVAGAGAQGTVDWW